MNFIGNLSELFHEVYTFVNVLEHNEFKRKPIVTGFSDGIQIEIVSGISETDRIKK
ncbi:MAG: hypothetical protein LBE56_00510 [Tannerella sp.]|jgi:hypothetical protein|nr:hypothetical protein [Tannerella sp.]